MRPAAGACRLAAVMAAPLLLTPPSPCGYLAGHWARSLWVAPQAPMTPQAYASLLAQGFRRSGGQVYRPACDACSACVPVRLAVAQFAPNRSQRRCWQKNAGVRVCVRPPGHQDSHFALYKRYQLAKHEGGGMAEVSAEDYLRFLASPWCQTLFVEFWTGGRLLAVAVVDDVEVALSAVYTFYEPELAGLSPGTLAVLWQVHQARALGYPHVYLGFWIKNCRKMAYKSRFRPLQGLVDGQWRELADDG